MRDGISVRGHLRVIERDARTGRVLDDYRGPNRVTSVGLDLLADRLRGNTAMSGLSHYAIGTGSTPPTAGDTALVAESYRDLLTQTSVTAGELTLTLFLGSTQGNGVTYQEGGAFNLQNTMLCRGLFPPKAKTNLTTLTIIHTIPLTAS